MFHQHSASTNTIEVARQNSQACLVDNADLVTRECSVELSNISLQLTDDVTPTGEKQQDPVGTDLTPDSNYRKPSEKRRQLKHGLSSSRALASFVKAMVGGGIMSVPLAFYNGGLWTSFGLCIIIALINIDCIYMLVQTSATLTERHSQDFLDYADVAELAFAHGPILYLRKHANVGRKIVNGFLLLTQMGLCCVYFVFLADHLHQVVEYYFDDVLSMHAMMACILLPIELVCSLRHLKHLGLLAAIANILLFGSFGVILQYLVQEMQPLSRLPAFNSWSTLPLFFGTAMLAFEGIAVILPIRNKMTHPEELTQWNGVLNTGFTVVVCLYLAFGFFGYGAVGDQVKGSIILNLPTDNPIYQVLKLTTCIAIYITYAVQFYVVVEIVSPFFQKQFATAKLPACLPFQMADLVDYMCRFLLVLVTFILAEIIPHLGLIISLVGSVATTGICIIFPPILWHLTMEEAHWGVLKWRLWKNIVILLTGMIGFATGTYSALRDIITTVHNEI